ncbi:MAG: hypothetical protein E7257_05745 [Lachnospiraceae bacterium]|nr:hypothetical protein [Lachnospiraceae bacterium]
MSGDKYIKKISSNKLFRFMAWVALVIIVGLVIATIITGLTGSKYFLGFLILSMIAPVFVYAVLTIGRVLYNATHGSNPEGDIEEEKIINK